MVMPINHHILITIFMPINHHILIAIFMQINHHILIAIVMPINHHILIAIYLYISLLYISIILNIEDAEILILPYCLHMYTWYIWRWENIQQILHSIDLLKRWKMVMFWRNINIPIPSCFPKNIRTLWSCRNLTAYARLIACYSINDFNIIVYFWIFPKY